MDDSDDISKSIEKEWLKLFNIDTLQEIFNILKKRQNSYLPKLNEIFNIFKNKKPKQIKCIFLFKELHPPICILDNFVIDRQLDDLIYNIKKNMIPHAQNEISKILSNPEEYLSSLFDRGIIFMYCSLTIGIDEQSHSVFWKEFLIDLFYHLDSKNLVVISVSKDLEEFLYFKKAKMFYWEDLNSQKEKNNFKRIQKDILSYFI